mgnify:CR=1 FL=1
MSLVIISTGILVSCEENQNPAMQVTAEDLSENSTFISIIKENEAAIYRFETYINSTNLKSEEIIGQFADQLRAETDYSKLITYLGYKSVDEFENINSELYTKYKLLAKSYPELEDKNRLKILFKEATGLYLLTKDVIPSNLSKQNKGAKTKVNCAGGQACIKSASLCLREAEIDFAVTAAACNGFVFNPLGWAFCQGGANISYWADITVCDDNLSSCCNIYE